MIDPSPLPSRHLQLFARLARWALRLLLAFWLLVAAVWGTLHGFIVPRIGDWRPEIEHMATQALGVQVHISHVKGETDGLFPRVYLEGISILDEQGRQALKLQTVIATISARSVLRLGLEQLYIQAPSIDIRHRSNGSWEIAGMPMVSSENSDNKALHWLLEQPELLIREGSLRFIDEQNTVQPLLFQDAELVLRNRAWHHEMRLEATPVASSTKRMLLIGRFRDALLPTTQAPWHHWTGQLFADVHLDQIPTLPLPAAWGVQQLQGNGHTRVWIDVKNGQPAKVAADLAWPHAKVQWNDPALKDLELHEVQGRLHLHQQELSWHIDGQNFSFRNNDRGFWPSSNWAVQLQTISSRMDSVALRLDYADVTMASKVVQSLPLPAAIQQPLARLAPQGEIHQLDVRWKADGAYQINGEVRHLTLQPQPSVHGVGTPGMEGMHAHFAFDQHGGQASLHMQNGLLHFPGVFEEPALPLQQLDAKLRWSIENERVKLEVPEATFANADAQGAFNGWWRMGESLDERLPGELHLQGTLNKADGARVYRYLPVQIPEVARHYVRDSVRHGQARGVTFEVNGLLKDMPFDRPEAGRFYIHAPLYNVVYDFVPPTETEAAWPALHQLNGDLIFEGSSMRVQQAQSGFEGHPRLHMGTVSAHIADLNHPVVQVHASGDMDMAHTLALVRHSPLSHYTSQALDAAQATGKATIGFDLELPIDRLQQSKVQGKVIFQNTALRFASETPWLHQLQGVVQFSETGFALHDVQGYALGGPFTLQGGMGASPHGMHIKAKGTATVQGMQQETDMALLSEIAKYASGSTPYTVDITASEGKQEVSVYSNLQGVALQLPAPFNKAARTDWPLTVRQTVSADQPQTLEVSVPQRLQVTYVQEHGAADDSQMSGRIVVGEARPEPISLGSGVSVHIRTDTLDVDAWRQAMSAYRTTADSRAASTFLPQRLELDIKRLLIQGRHLLDVKADFQASHGTWRGHFSAQQFAGYAQYSTPSLQADAGRIFARLSHLSIPQAEVHRLSEAVEDSEPADLSTLPALDIEVEQLQIADKMLGKLVLQARNSNGLHGRNWTLEQFNLSTPEASWKAHGTWAMPEHSALRKTHLSFLLEMDNAGQLLERLGLPDVIRDGKGRLNGNVRWQGSPISPDWKSMDGGIHMQVEKGQFLKVEPGMGKLLSVLSLQSLPRRAVLDFRDVFSQGFAFDFIRGDIAVEQGVARTNNLQMRGLNAAVLMEGNADLVGETQDLKVVVVPEINAMTASLAATAINPVIGLGSFLAQMFLRGPLMEAATRTFHVHGTWADPIFQPLGKPTFPYSDEYHQGSAP